MGRHLLLFFFSFSLLFLISVPRSNRSKISLFPSPGKSYNKQLGGLRTADADNKTAKQGHLQVNQFRRFKTSPPWPPRPKTAFQNRKHQRISVFLKKFLRSETSQDHSETLFKIESSLISIIYNKSCTFASSIGAFKDISTNFQVELANLF